MILFFKLIWYIEFQPSKEVILIIHTAVVWLVVHYKHQESCLNNQLFYSASTLCLRMQHRYGSFTVLVSPQSLVVRYKDKGKQPQVANLLQDLSLWSAFMDKTAADAMSYPYTAGDASESLLHGWWNQSGWSNHGWNNI